MTTQSEAFVTVKREVLEQAIDALSEADNVLTSSMFAESATALRAALEQPGVEPCGVVESAAYGCEGYHVRMWPGTDAPRIGTKLYAAPQPAQQAVTPLGYIPSDAVGQLEPPRLILNGVPIYTYEFEGSVAIYTTSPDTDALLHQARATAIKDCIDRLIQGGKPAEAGMLRHHFAKDLGGA